MKPEERLLALGGVHALEAADPCHLVKVEPADALDDLHWKDALVVRARSEGLAELACGEHRTRLRIVKPDRLDLVLVDEHVVVGQRFQVRAVPRAAGKEIEIGKWTEIQWRGDATFAVDNDKSAGEFGLCPTCFGASSFRAAGPASGTIQARFGDLTAILKVAARP